MCNISYMKSKDLETKLWPAATKTAVGGEQSEGSKESAITREKSVWRPLDILQV